MILCYLFDLMISWLKVQCIYSYIILICKCFTPMILITVNWCEWSEIVDKYYTNIEKGGFLSFSNTNKLHIELSAEFRLISFHTKTLRCCWETTGFTFQRYRSYSGQMAGHLIGELLGFVLRPFLLCIFTLPPLFDCILYPISTNYFCICNILVYT